MSWFDPVPRSELGTTFTHYGWFAGLVPVYIGDADSDMPLLAERNWVPAWLFWVVEVMLGLFCWVSSVLFPGFEPAFPILITGEIPR